MKMIVGFVWFVFPPVTFSVSIRNVEFVFDCRTTNTNIFENNVFTISSELATDNRSYVLQNANNLKNLIHISKGFLN